MTKKEIPSRFALFGIEQLLSDIEQFSEIRISKHPYSQTVTFMA
ncbi:hypothetical protein [Sphingobacterium wenxiniae]|nr:hypothetical protein [Sphingobacterium wenxiniae]